MSRRWNRALRLQIGPQALTATLESGWPKPRRVAEASTAATEDLGPGEARDLDAARLDALLQEIQVVATLRGARLDVELADRWVHYDVAAGDFGSQSDADLQTIATACAAELLGDAALGFEVRWSLQAGERHLLIAAVPRPLIDTLVAAADVHGLRLASIQPAFACRWNAALSRLDATGAVIATTSAGHAMVTCVIDGAVRAISVGPWHDAAQGAAGADPTPFLEERATRLLAELGVDDGSRPHYLLGWPDDAVVALSSRWAPLVGPAPAP